MAVKKFNNIGQVTVFMSGALLTVLLAVADFASKVSN
jgi:hypothetical protein